MRRNVEHLVELLAAIPGLELALTTNGALLPQKAEALARAGLDRVTVSLDSVDDHDLQSAERRRLPRRPRARGHRRRRRRRACASRSTRSSSAARTTTGSSRSPSTSAARRTRSASSSTWTSAARTAGASTTSCPPTRSSSGSTRSGRSSPLPLARPDDTSRRFAYRDGAGEIGVIASVTKPFCGGCSQGAALGRGTALHVPVRRERPRSARAAPHGSLR